MGITRTFTDELELFLRQAISSDYTRCIAEHIEKDVKQDLEECADEDYNEDDLRLAIGRVLIDKLRIDY